MPCEVVTIVKLGEGNNGDLVSSEVESKDNLKCAKVVSMLRRPPSQNMMEHLNLASAPPHSELRILILTIRVLTIRGGGTPTAPTKTHTGALEL
eukprot:1982127-Amphidinium_carterae.1